MTATRVIRSAITGVGGYLPEEIVTNDDLAKIVDTTDEWIVERTGIRKRHRIAEGQGTSDLAVEAAKKALAAAGRTPADVDMIIVATSSTRPGPPPHVEVSRTASQPRRNNQVSSTIAAPTTAPVAAAAG